MTPVDFDLLVIGGGPAGSCSAAFARQQGLSVCLVEKETFPRFRIGESLLPMGNQVLRDVGVWDKVASAGFIPKYGARFCLADGSAEKEIEFANGLIPGLESTFQVERCRFDGILLEHAQSLGAEVRREITVKGVVPSDDHITATLAARDGTTTTVTSRWLIDAGGRENLYPSELKKTLDPSPFPKRIAIYNHFRGVPRPPGKRGGNIIIVRLEGGWFWIIPIDAERTSVGCVQPLANVRSAGVEPAEIFRQTVAASPKLQELLGDAKPTMSFHVTADYSYFRRELAAERIVLAGDAGGFFDPIFSSGVYMATWSAQQAVAMIAKAHSEQRVLRPEERLRHSRRVKKHAGTFQRFIASFYDNDSFAVFLTQVPPMDLGRGINSIVAGHAKMTWGLWWRFKIFLLVCRLQKKFGVMVKPIDYAAAAAAGKAI